MKARSSLTRVHNASSSMAGYLFQARYALLRGLEEGKRNPGHVISIEKFDDVAFEDADQPVELIQTKHHGEPGDTSDKSVDVWRTLNIWLKRVAGDPVAASSTRFVFLTTNTAADGSALSKLRQAEESRDVPCAIALLIAAANTSENQATKAARSAFLSLDTAMRKLLIENIWVFDKAPNIIDVRDEIEEVLHYSAPVGKVGTFTDYLEGWWFRRVILSLTDPNGSAIPLTAVQSKISEIRDNFKMDRLPLDETIDAMPPITTMPGDDRVFVRQMNLIGVFGDAALATVHDYYRASQQRSRWARENLLLDGETENYDRSLRDEWRRRFLAWVDDIAEPCNDAMQQACGKKIFRWACVYQKPLRNRDETWLSSGSFQILADTMRVGWHPNYKTLLSSEEE